MTNFQVYKKTLSFSVLQFVIDIAVLIVLIGSCALGFVLLNQTTNKALIGLGVGLVVGIVIAILVDIFLLNRVKAAQISMMTMGVLDGKLPDNTFKAGFESVKDRFAKITGFYFISHLIKGVFRQLGKGISNVGQAVGGDVGGSIGTAIDSAIQILIGYMCDCCMGWILYRKEENGFRAGCEGAVIFFKHGKTLIRNIGRIFGLGILSFVVIGGAFFGLFYLISNQIPQVYQTLANEIAELGVRYDFTVASALLDPKVLMLIVSGILAVILFGMIHSVLIRPFVLVGVLRNFMAAGVKDMPQEADFIELNKKSPRFAKLYNRA